MKICICDDDRSFAEKLKTVLVAYSFKTNYEFQFKIYHNTDDLLSNDIDYHILFMDIRFGSSDIGIKAAKEIKKRSLGLYIVFVTSLPRYAIDGYSARPFAYLVKPLDESELRSTMGELITTMEHKPEERGILSISANKSTSLIIHDAIQWVQSDSVDKKRTIVTKDRQYVTRERLKDIYSKLPSEKFAYCHQSYIVNLSLVSEVRKSSVLLTTGDEVPLGRTNKMPFVFALNQFAGGRQ